ncbi:hypothetical protein OF83DRAFT_1140590 [Amylostereum chailletii]|nr:hypothetical protein OF83DRAFT_1140590 [Amylostereum chailletii]
MCTRMRHVIAYSSLAFDLHHRRFDIVWYQYSVLRLPAVQRLNINTCCQILQVHWQDVPGQRSNHCNLAVNSHKSLRWTFTTARQFHMDSATANDCPIHQLPVELLLNIFSDSISYFPDDHPCVTSMAISHVCKQWRDVALQSKILWSYIPLENGKKWTQLALDRSRPVPIDVHGMRNFKSRSSIPKRQIAVALATQELARIRVLTLDILGTGRNVEMKFMDSLTRSPAPILENFALDSKECIFNIPDGLFAGAPLRSLRYLSTQDCNISERIFSAANPPDIRHLTLEDGRVPFSSSLLQCPLTSLVVIGTTIWTTTGEILDTLARLPSLQELKLRHTFVEPTGHRHPPVHLPNLRLISLRDTPLRSSTPILRDLSFPLNAHVSLAFQVYYEERENCGLVKSFIQSHYSSDTSSGLYFDKVVICVQDLSDPEDDFDNGYTFRAMRTNTRGSEGSDHSPSELGDLHISCCASEGIDDEPPKFAIDLLKTLSRQRVISNSLRTIQITYPFFFVDDGVYTEVFQATCDNVVSLEVHGDAAYGIFGALAANSPPIFPNLETLSLYHTDVQFSSNHEEEEEDDPTVSLQASLHARKTTEARSLRALQIIDCTVKKADVDCLRAALGPATTVEWDGLELSTVDNIQ